MDQESYIYVWYVQSNARPSPLHIVYLAAHSPRSLAWQNKNKLTSIDADNNQIAITTAAATTKQNK